MLIALLALGQFAGQTCGPGGCSMIPPPPPPIRFDDPHAMDQYVELQHHLQQRLSDYFEADIAALGALRAARGKAIADGAWTEARQALSRARAAVDQIRISADSDARGFVIRTVAGGRGSPHDVQIARETEQSVGWSAVGSLKDFDELVDRFLSSEQEAVARVR